MLPRRPRHRRRGRWAGRRRRDPFDPGKSRDERSITARSSSREALGWLGDVQNGAHLLSVRGERPSAERFEHGLALAFISTIKRNGRLSARKFNYFASEHLGGGLGNTETTARPTETTENALSVAVPLSPPSSSRWPRRWPQSWRPASTRSGATCPPCVPARCSRQCWSSRPPRSDRRRPERPPWTLAGRSGDRSPASQAWLSLTTGTRRRLVARRRDIRRIGELFDRIGGDELLQQPPASPSVEISVSASRDRGLPRPYNSGSSPK